MSHRGLFDNLVKYQPEVYEPVLYTERELSFELLQLCRQELK